MQEFIEFFSHLCNPEWIIQNGGLYIVVLIVFIETGLFFGFFLPGDPLLFIAGMVIANTLAPFGLPLVNLLYWVTLITAAGVIGNYAGYWFGKKSGGLLLERKDNWLFKKKYLLQATEFYEKKGGSAIVLARFLPVVRTFAPIVAGLVKMDARKFAWYNFAGSFLWAGTIFTSGFLLGDNQWVRSNLEKIILGIVVVSTAPVLIKLLTGRKKRLELKTVPALSNSELKKAEQPARQNTTTIF
jgi:membrane-associated protein